MARGAVHLDVGERATGATGLHREPQRDLRAAFADAGAVTLVGHSGTAAPATGLRGTSRTQPVSRTNAAATAPKVVPGRAPIGVLTGSLSMVCPP